MTKKEPDMCRTEGARRRRLLVKENCPPTPRGRSGLSHGSKDLIIVLA
jgi:hypothetical protein